MVILVTVFLSVIKNRYDKEIEILSIVIYFILMAVAVDFKEWPEK